jgi:serralysin
MAGTYQDLLVALGYSESTNRYDYVNSLGYAGRYQFGEAALRMIGYYGLDGTAAADWNNGWTGKDGINSLADWLANPAVQDKALSEWFNYLWTTEIRDFGLHQYVGTTINGTPITESGILAGAHLVGADQVAVYLNSGGALGATDPFGTPVAEYIAKFSGYAVDPISAPATPPGSETPAPTPAPEPSSEPAPDPISMPANETLTGTKRADKLVGDAGDDTIMGNNGNDQISGEGGNDHLWGGGGSDTFVFKAGFGHDTIEDFGSGRKSQYDLIEFSSNLFSGFSTVMSRTTDTPDGALISYDSDNSVLLKGVLKSSLAASDFHFI